MNIGGMIGTTPSVDTRCPATHPCRLSLPPGTTLQSCSIPTMRCLAHTSIAKDAQRLPTIVPMPNQGTPFRMVSIGGGNMIDGQDGIKVSSSQITNLPAAYGPNTSPACADGIGWDTLCEDGVSRGKVLVVNDNRSTLACFVLAGGLRLRYPGGRDDQRWHHGLRGGLSMTERDYSARARRDFAA